MCGGDTNTNEPTSRSGVIGITCEQQGMLDVITYNCDTNNNILRVRRKISLQSVI